MITKRSAHTLKSLLSATGFVALLIQSSSSALAATATRAPFGKMPDGTLVEAVTLANSKGISATLITYGATIQALNVPDRKGVIADIELGYDDLASYLTKPNYWGSTIGRYANRIGGAHFVLDGKTYQISRNNKTATLHGGAEGFDKRVWQIGAVKQGPTVSVAMTLVSPDGDQGYPGELRATVTYSLDDAGSLTLDFDATSNAPTVVNLTNHALFNMAGEGSAYGVLNQRLTIPASHYTPVDEALIPTGVLQPVAGTVFDFTKGRLLWDGLRDGHDPQIVIGRGYDHNFAIDAGLTKTTKLVARMEDPASGRVMEILSTEPGLQVYTGNFLDGTLIGKGGHIYRMGDGIALEPQKFPDAPNQPAFVSGRVEPGKPYHHRMVLKFSTTP